MKVSAIIPTYNRLPYIGRAIDSILAQTVPVDEILVVDDGSSDGTAEAVESRYGAAVRIIRQKNTGVSGARLRGIHEARGEWIAFLDSDDEWMPGRNRQLLDAAMKVPADVAWVFGDLRLVTDEGEGPTLFEKYKLNVYECPQECPQVFENSLLVQYPFQFGMLQGSFIRRKALLDLGCFTQNLRSSEDLLAGFQVACHYRYAAIPSVVGKYFQTSDLKASSLVRSQTCGADYHRSRMLSFAEVIKAGRGREPWNRYYAAEVRDYCKVLAEKGDVPRALALEQFRYGAFSLKGMAFLLAATFGRPGILAWNRLAARRRRYRVQSAEVREKQWAAATSPQPRMDEHSA